MKSGRIQYDITERGITQKQPPPHVQQQNPHQPSQQMQATRTNVATTTARAPAANSSQYSGEKRKMNE
jgi:hypothetical protein